MIFSDLPSASLVPSLPTNWVSAANANPGTTTVDPTGAQTWTNARGDTQIKSYPGYDTSAGGEHLVPAPEYGTAVYGPPATSVKKSNVGFIVAGVGLAAVAAFILFKK